jgi:hypothetical protein
VVGATGELGQGFWGEEEGGRGVTGLGEERELLVVVGAPPIEGPIEGEGEDVKPAAGHLGDRRERGDLAGRLLGGALRGAALVVLVVPPGVEGPIEGKGEGEVSASEDADRGIGEKEEGGGGGEFVIYKG